jgi:hypothetical protein
VGAEELPWRPLTIGELLDAAVATLRRRPIRLLLVATLLAATEQVALYPIRHGMFSPAHNYFSGFPDFFSERWWTLIAVGMGTEATVIAMLGAVAAGPARELLLSGVPVAPGRFKARPIGTTILSLIVGVIAFATFWAGVIGWVFWFMFTALVTPTLINDAMLGARASGKPAKRLSTIGAFGRALALVRRAGLRPGGARLLAYGAFALMRILLAWAGLFALGQYVRVPAAVEYAIWIIVNAIMYSYLASLDATAHLETRMRQEGLDMELGRAERLGTPIADALVVPR